jgi:hypothetical protein
MSQMIQEYFDSRGVELRVDAQAGVIRGVKILGLESRNRRNYAAQALTGATHLYEGAKVNVNHPQGNPLAPRDYRDRIGVIRGVEFRDGQGLFGDFHFNPKHALAEQLTWDAEHATENVGFSHNVQARVAKEAGSVLVEEIVQVQSVDLVADPATTRGLFEQENVDAPGLERAVVQALEQQVGTLQRKLDEYVARETLDQKRDSIRALLAEYQLPDPASADPTAQAVVSEQFISELLATATESEMRALVRDRAKLVRSLGIAPGRAASGKPVSRDQGLVDQRPDVGQVATAKSFAEAIT